MSNRSFPCRFFWGTFCQSTAFPHLEAQYAWELCPYPELQLNGGDVCRGSPYAGAGTPPPHGGGPIGGHHVQIGHQNLEKPQERLAAAASVAVAVVAAVAVAVASAVVDDDEIVAAVIDVASAVVDDDEIVAAVIDVTAAVGFFFYAIVVVVGLAAAAAIANVIASGFPAAPNIAFPKSALPTLEMIPDSMMFLL